MAKGDHITNDAFITEGLERVFGFMQGATDECFEGLRVYHGDTHKENNIVFTGTLYQFNLGDFTLFINSALAEKFRIEGARYRIAELWSEFREENEGMQMAYRLKEILDEIDEISRDFGISPDACRNLSSDL